MAGTLTISTLSDGTNSTSSTNCIQGSAKAWVNFDGNTGSGNTIRASYNISSITRSATGAYTINFTNALVDANYSCVGTVGILNSGANSFGFANIYDSSAVPTTTNVTIQTGNNSAIPQSYTRINISIFR